MILALIIGCPMLWFGGVYSCDLAFKGDNIFWGINLYFLGLFSMTAAIFLPITYLKG